MVRNDTLTADGRASNLTYVHPEDYTGLSLTPYDIDFGGTSSGCPTCGGWITTKLQYNRGWTWRDIKNWLVNNCGVKIQRDFTMVITIHLLLQQHHNGKITILNTYGQGSPL